jgi:hypothetical protein
MAGAAQLAAVFIALVFVLGAGGYGVTRGLTGESNPAYDYCTKQYEKALWAIEKYRSLPPASASDFCHAFLRGEVTSLR